MLNKKIQKTWSTIYFNKFFILQEDIKIISSYLANDKHTKDMKQKLTALKEKCSFLHYRNFSNNSRRLQDSTHRNQIQRDAV